VTSMAIVLLPLILTAITVVAVWRAYAAMADELDQLRVVVARTRSLRPVVGEISAGARRLSSGLSRLSR
jgi:hypothetical protein